MVGSVGAARSWAETGSMGRCCSGRLRPLSGVKKEEEQAGVCVDGQGNLRHICLSLGLSPPQGHFLPFLEGRMGGSSPAMGIKVWLTLKHHRKPFQEKWVDTMLHVRLKQE